MQREKRKEPTALKYLQNIKTIQKYQEIYKGSNKQHEIQMKRSPRKN